MNSGLTELVFYASIPLAIALAVVVVAWVVQYMRRAPDLGQHYRVVLHRGPVALSLVLLAVGLILTMQVSVTAREQANTEAHDRFLKEVEQLDASMQKMVRELVYPLDSVRGVFIASHDVTRTDFRRLVSLGLQNGHYSGLHGVSFVERVARTDVASFVARQRAQGAQRFAVQTSGTASDLLVVKYMEPMHGNGLAQGLDLGADPILRQAAEAAMRSGQPALSRPVHLPQDSLQRPSLFYFMPIYLEGGDPGSAAERVRQLRGWAAVPVVLAEFFSSVNSNELPWLNFQVYERPELDASGLLYDSEIPSGVTTMHASQVRHLQRLMSVVRPVMLADQVFFVRSNSTPDFEAAYAGHNHLRIAFIGASLSVLGAMVTWLLLAGRAHALSVAASMTADLDRLALVARRTSNAVIFTDEQSDITWVNEGFSRITGYTSDEVLGRNPVDFLWGPEADQDVLKPVNAGRGAEWMFHEVVPCQRKDGQTYWADFESQPIVGPNGKLQGYMTVQSDVTEEVKAKAALVIEKERAENILSGTNVGTWESNLVTGESQWNDRWGEMLGFSHEEVVPNADAFWQERLHPDDRARMRNALVSCISGTVDSYACDVRARRKDGSWMWILSSAKVMSRRPSGEAEWIGGIHTDITEFKHVETSLRDMESFLDRAGRIAGVGAWQIDLKTGQIVFSDQTCAIHGLPQGYRPTREELLRFYPPTDRQRLQQAMDRGMEEGKSWDLELAFTNVQGYAMWVRQFGEVEFDDSGPVRVVGAFQDVTNDKKARLEVQRSGELLRGAIDVINEAFVLYDPQDRLVFCNDKYRALYSKAADVMTVGATFEKILRVGAERGQYRAAEGRIEDWVQERLAAHRRADVAIEQQIDNGRWLKVVERKMPDGHTVGFRMDITELKMATATAESVSAALAEERKRLQNILEGTNVGTWEWNVQTGENIYNTQYLAMLGFTQEEFGSGGHDTWARLCDPGDRAVADQKMQAHLSGESAFYEAEIRMRHKDGSWRWVLGRGKLARHSQDGRPLWVYGTHMDITERKLAEEKLAETSATLQNVLDSATHVGVISAGVDRVIRVFNKGAENLLGYQADEMVGRRTASPFFDLSEIGALRESLELVLGRTPSTQDVFEHVVGIREQQEWTLIRKDGSRFIASLISSPIRNALGEVDGHLMIIYDISRQKEYETSLRQAMLLAEQSSVAKSQFLANMSHEIRTPMNAILGMLQLLHNTVLNVRQRDYADKAEGAARSLLGLLNDILDFSKVEAGKMQLDPEPFLLEDLLGDLSVILSSNLGRKNVDLVFEVDPQIPHELVGDSLRLKQVLINLGGNAVKFTNQGEVVMRWSLLARTPERVKVAVAVEDTGIGIAEENQSRIFEAFTQAEANTTRRFGGTGLGLVISTRLIRLMGGELKLNSVVGRGSIFSFILEFPVVERELAAAEALQSLAPPRPVCRAMLVDDSARTRAGAGALMRGLGWTVTEADSGEQALDGLATMQAQGTRPDVVFVDWQMPGMDGWETLRRAALLYGDQPRPFFVLLSCHNREALAQRTEREQELLSGFMVKPLTSSMFLQALSMAQFNATAATPQPLVPKSVQRRLQGMRLLLVEDNPINQQVAHELLSAEGAHVTLAGNGMLGLEALEVAQPLFDAVLMDLQMPVMDGLTAARAIRANPRYDRVPVIAMTANAMSSDREACLDAGMNDHVGKPFDLAGLVQTLLKHTGWQTSAALQAPLLPAIPAPAVESDWPAGLDVALALARMGGNRGLLARAIEAFVLDAATLPQRLGPLLPGADMAQVKRDLHAFKGLSATLGAGALSELAAQAERSVNDTSHNGHYQAAVAALLELLEPTLPALREVAARLQSPPAATVPVAARAPGAQWLKQLQCLWTALQASDMEAMEMHAALRQSVDGATAQALEPLDAAMADLEFEAAAVECAKLVDQFGVSAS